jgi:hypothetical protein
MLGPLAKLEAPAAEPAAAEIAPAKDTPSADGPAAAPAAEAPLLAADYPIERCARLAARVELHESERPKILEAEGLTPETFDRLAQHWSAAVDKESLRGKSTLMRAYDTAYIGQIESERGPVSIKEYARIAVAMENGTVEEALTALGLPRRSAMPIRRMWTQKVFKDPKLAAQVRQAVLAEREG